MEELVDRIVDPRTNILAAWASIVREEIRLYNASDE